MNLTEDTINNFAELIKDLDSHLIIDNIPADPPFLSMFDNDYPFALDDHGYKVSYLNLLLNTLNLKPFGDQWSHDGLEKLANNLIYKLAENKHNQNSPVNYAELAKDWLSKVVVSFDEQICYTIVVGLSVEAPLQLGDITFLPPEIQYIEVADNISTPYLQNLNPMLHCLASCKINAEQVRATEILCEKTENILNILRFIGSLIWHDQPIRHIYISGYNRNRVNYSLAIDSKKRYSRIGNSIYTPLPFKVDKEFLNYAKAYGFDYIRGLLELSSTTEIERAFLTAIQWYGDATQDLIPIISFVKYYVSIETVLKNKSENAHSVLPKRLSKLISPFNNETQKLLEIDIGGMIDERNSVLHSGKTEKMKPEELSWNSRIFARQALHQICQIMQKEELKTKKDLLRWLKDKQAQIGGLY